jgi:outer membrane protein OmpA-like peptidoglycan-associated protein
MNRILLLIAIFALTLPIARAQDQDSPGTADHPMITRYEGSILDGYEFREYDDFELPLGPAVKDESGNRIASEKETLEGTLTRLLYRGPDERTTMEIRRNYQMALEEKGFEVLYECSDTDCGYLFHWLLYKDDRITNSSTSGNAFDMPGDLRYLAARKATADGAVTHVSLMVAIDQMWSKQPVTLLEIVEAKPMDIGMVTVNAEAMAESIDAVGHIAIYGIYFDTGSDVLKADSDTTLAEIARLLVQRPDLSLLVVGHTDNQGSYEMNMGLSARRASAVVGALVNRFEVDAERLTDAGVGYLAPVATNDTEEGRAKNRRVELVKR